MGAIVSTNLKLAGARSEFLRVFEASNGTALYSELTTRIPSDKDVERYRWLGAIPPMRAWGTGRQARGVYQEAYDIENMKYEITLEVDRDEIADDQTGQIMIRIREIAQRAGQHKDLLLAALLASGDQAGYLSYDGAIFFSAAHESGLSGSQTNILTPAAVAPDAPTVAEFKTAMASAFTALMTLKDDQGEPAASSATGLVAVVPPGMYLTALEALSATVIDATTNVLSGAAKIVAFPRLTDASKWFLLKTDAIVRPFIFQDREPVEFKSLEGDSETGFRKEVYEYGVRARYRIAYGAWNNALQLNFV